MKTIWSNRKNPAQESGDMILIQAQPLASNTTFTSHSASLGVSIFNYEVMKWDEITPLGPSKSTKGKAFLSFLKLDSICKKFIV